MNSSDIVSLLRSYAATQGRLGSHNQVATVVVEAVGYLAKKNARAKILQQVVATKKLLGMCIEIRAFLIAEGRDAPVVPRNVALYWNEHDEFVRDILKATAAAISADQSGSASVSEQLLDRAAKGMPCLSSRQLAKELGVHHTSISRAIDSNEVLKEWKSRSLTVRSESSHLAEVARFCDAGVAQWQDARTAYTPAETEEARDQLIRELAGHQIDDPEDRVRAEAAIRDLPDDRVMQLYARLSAE